MIQMYKINSNTFVTFYDPQHPTMLCGMCRNAEQAQLTLILDDRREENRYSLLWPDKSASQNDCSTGLCLNRSSD